MQDKDWKNEVDEQCRKLVDKEIRAKLSKIKRKSSRRIQEALKSKLNSFVSSVWSGQDIMSQNTQQLEMSLSHDPEQIEDKSELDSAFPLMSKNTLNLPAGKEQKNTFKHSNTMVQNIQFSSTFPA